MADLGARRGSGAVTTEKMLAELIRVIGDIDFAESAETLEVQVAMLMGYAGALKFVLESES